MYVSGNVFWWLLNEGKTTKLYFFFFYPHVEGRDQAPSLRILL